MNRPDHSLSNEQDYIYKNCDKNQVIEDIMAAHDRTVYLLAYSFVKDKSLAEDIAQEVFIKCFKHLDQFRGEAKLKSWLCRITINTAKDFIRKKSFKVLKFPKVFFENLTKTDSSENVFLKKDRNEYVLKQVLALPVKYREVIVLHYFNDLKVEEISGLLDLKVNTVKTRLARGRERLKKVLEPVKGGESLE